MVTRVPGVEVEKSRGFPPSVTAASTSVSAFVGYTEKAEHVGRSLHNTPWRVVSMPDFERYFGGAPTASHVRFSFTEAALTDAQALALAGSRYRLTQTHGFYALHRAMQLYFLNGGGPCYVVSVGEYGSSAAPGVQLSASAFSAGLQALQAEAEPAIVLIPEAVWLLKADCDAVQNRLLSTCSLSLPNRFAILDVREGHRARSSGPTDCIQDFRNAVGVGVGVGAVANGLSFGAAYYPWLNTSVVSPRTLGFKQFSADSLPTLVAVMQYELATLSMTPLRRKRLLLEASRIAAVPADDTKAQAALAKRWAAISPAFNAVTHEMAQQLNRLPPSAAMAGVFSATDALRGVWKAPANVALNGVLSPTVLVSDHDQASLNVDAEQGKSVNALRAFPGKGVLVWGSRTLDGNSHDWRYISVRRTVMMVEQSVNVALAGFALAANDTATWTTVRGMLENYLNSLWSQGALVGAQPQQAFFVRVGLGATMTATDVANGLLIAEMGLALLRPAEFIVVRAQLQM
jgi:uncharacterized protein